MSAKSKLKVAKKKRGGHKGWTTSLATEISEKLTTETEKEELLVLKKSLVEKLENLKILDDEILDLLCEDDDVDDDEVQKEVEESGKLRQGMTKVLVQLESKLEMMKEKSLSNVGQKKSEEIVNVVTAANQPSRVRLPKMDIRKFSGKVCDWQEFWDAFNSCIHNNNALSAVEKFTYLRSYLVDSARACVAGFALTDANYQAAVELLKERFGKDVVVRRAHINGLMNVRPVFNESDVMRLRTLYDQVETHHRTLAALGADEQSYSSIIVPSLLEKLPETIRLAITRGKAEYEEWILEDLLKNLKIELELREQHQSTLRSPRKDWPLNSGTSGTRKPAPSTSSTLLLNQAVRCAFCLGDHPHEQCAKIASIGERKNLIRKYGRCFTCLKKGHKSRDCKSKPPQCSICNDGHHTALHE